MRRHIQANWAGFWLVAHVTTVGLGVGALGALAGCQEEFDPPTAVIELLSTATPGVGSAVTLDGTASHSPGSVEDAELLLDYEWTMVSTPAGSEAEFVNAIMPMVAFEPDLAGQYVIGLRVTDSHKTSSMARLTVTVSECGAGVPTVESLTFAPLSPALNQAVQMTATVGDPDNSEACGLSQELSYDWSIVAAPSGATASVNDADTTTPFFIGDVAGDYQIRVVVTDDTGLSSDPFVATVQVVECGGAAPVVDSLESDDDSYGIGDLVSFAATVSDLDNTSGSCALDQTLTVTTEFVARPAGSSAVLAPEVGLTPAFVADVAGDYTVRTTVVDDTGLATWAVATVSVAPCGGADPSINEVVASPVEPNTGDRVVLTVDATDSDNTAGCDAGQSLLVSSEFVGRPAGSAALLNPEVGSTPSFVVDVPGIYVVRTTVTDSTGRTESTDTSISASSCGDSAPSVVSQIATPEAPNTGDLVTLNVAVADADADPAGCNLTQTFEVSTRLVGLPAGSAATLAPSAGLTPAFVPDVPGTYVLRTTVVDESGRAGTASTSVTVSTCGSANPSIASVAASPASPNTLEQVTLSVSAFDADNDPAGCSLAQVLTSTSEFVSRPAGSSSTLDPSVGTTPAFVPDVAGEYVVRTTVVDGTGRSTTRDTTVVASACGSAPPVVDSIALAFGTPNTGELVDLDVAVSDADNTGCSLSQALTVSSSLVGAPAGSSATMAPADGTSPAFVADMPGDYIVRVTVVDSTGATTSSDFVVTVSTCGTAAPEAFVGLDAPISVAPSSALIVEENVAVDGIVALDGSSSFDPDATAPCGLPSRLSYAWWFTSKPAGSTAEFNDASIANPSFVPDVTGVYEITLRVSDGTSVGFATASIQADAVAILAFSGDYEVEFVAGGSALWNNPEGLTIGGDGAIYVVQNGAGRITRTFDGVTTSFARGGTLPNTHDIAYYAAGNQFFVASDSFNAVVRIESNGLQTIWSAFNAVDRPRGVDIFTNSGGQVRLVVADDGPDRLNFFNPSSGTGATNVGTEDFNGLLDNPWGVDAVVIGGTNTYFTSDDGNGELFRTDGSNDRRLSQFFDSPRGVAFSAGTGAVFIADANLGMILRVDNCGGGDCNTTPIVWGDFEPWGLHFESATSLLVTDRANNALYRVRGSF